MPNNPNAIKNLRPPIQKGEVRNPGGRPKGTVNFSYYVKKILESEDWLNKVIKHGGSKPKWFDEVAPKTFTYAIITAVAVKAMQGDVMAAAWLKNQGWGDTFEAEPSEPRKLVYINKLPPREVRERKVIDGQIIKDTPDIQT